MNKTAIQWTDFTSNPIRYKNADGLDVWACSKVSAGCTNCYSEALALSPRMVSKGRALGARFNDAEMAKLTPYVDDGELAAILKAKPRGPFRNGDRPMVFLGDMTDVFGEWVTDEMLDRVFAVMALRPDITFQLLSKRPERMREYVADMGRHYVGDVDGEYMERWGDAAVALTGDPCSAGGPIEDCGWPLPNVWLGTSVENQEAADTRIPELLATPAAVRFLSCEPLLGPVGIGYAMCAEKTEDNEQRPITPGSFAGLHWVIVGGESGAGARPCDVGWIRDIVAQCRAAGVAPFVKQLGSKPVSYGEEAESVGNEIHRVAPGHPRTWAYKLKHGHGGDMAEWPEELRLREWPAGVA